MPSRNGPRDAAALVITRAGPREASVLLGRRHGGHVFMPNKFVFPGGRVDRGDARAPCAAPLRPEVLRALVRGCTEARARALALAAVRETFEEAGLLVGRRAAEVPRTRARAWAAFLAHGVIPALDALDYVARAITPPGEHRRYDTRFFWVDAAHVHAAASGARRGPGAGAARPGPGAGAARLGPGAGAARLGPGAGAALDGSGELLDLRWVPLSETSTLDLPEATAMVVAEVARRLAAREPRALPVRFVRYTRAGSRSEWL
jgi:8-oxo-dGTP pyrophosphatase MutT (NUDIX family)